MTKNAEQTRPRGDERNKLLKAIGVTMLELIIYDDRDKLCKYKNEKYENLQSAKMAAVNILKRTVNFENPCPDYYVKIVSEVTGEIVSKGEKKHDRDIVLWNDIGFGKINIEDFRHTDTIVLEKNLSYTLYSAIRMINELENRGKKVDIHVEQYVRTSYDGWGIPDGQSRTYIKFFVKDGKHNV